MAYGDELLAQACAHDLEGIIAKHRDRPYRAGRNGDWVKIKCIQSEGFMIVGYEQWETASGGLSSLLRAGRHGSGWVSADAVRNRVQRPGRRVSARDPRQAEDKEPRRAVEG